jgi:hypothetical protein
MSKYDELIGVERLYRALIEKMKDMSSYDLRMRFGHILCDAVTPLMAEIREEAKEQVAEKVGAL